MKTPAALLTLLIINTVAVAQAPIESLRDKNGLFGFMQDTVWAIPPIYQEVRDFANQPYAGVKTKGKWGLIDQAGKTIVPFQYDDFQYYEDSIAGIKKGKKFGVISLKTGRELVPVLYDQWVDFDQSWFSWSTSRQVVVVRRDGKEGVINNLGKEIIACVYDIKSIQEEDSARIRVKLNQKSGLVDRTGKVIVPCEYDIVELEGAYVNTTIFAKGKNNESTNLHGLYDTSGRMLAPCQYSSYIMFDEDNLAMVTLKTKGGLRYGLINRDGTLVVPAEIADEEKLMEAREKARR
jgi:hypothetical protein